MKTRHMVLVILFIAVFLIIGWSSASANSSNSQIQSTILYVKPGGISATCSSWDEPCELQQALTNATADTQIWVAAGTYKPTTGTDRTATFQLKSGVAIYGGFPVAGGSWEQRDWETNLTILSGDLAGNDGADFANYEENSIHVVTGSGVVATAILDGFTVSGGNANGSEPHYLGGGMYNISGSPTLTDVTFSSNNASNWGGGMYNYESDPSLTNVSFRNNSAETAGGAMYNHYSSPTLTEVSFSSNSSSYVAGGMYNGYSSPGLSNVTFLENTADFYGGGMYNYMSSPELTNVTFSENTAVYNGGGMYNEESSPTLTIVTFNDNDAEYYGGGIYNEISSSPILTNVTFSGNNAFDGGGIYNDKSNPTLINVTLSGNTAADSGGGMYNSYSSPTLTEVIFSNNQAYYGGGIYNYESNPSLSAVTFSGNFGDYGGGGGMFNSGGSPELTEVVFSNNSSSYAGGGMYNDYSSPSLTDVTFSENAGSDYGGGMYNIYSNPTLTNVTFSSNSAVYGGGMYNEFSNPSLTNVTLSGNTATYGGGMYNVESSPPLINAILWGNTPNQIINDDANSVPIVSFSVLQGGCPSGANCDNIIMDDPFLGPLADNGGFTLTHALREGSSAIDAGDPSSCPTTDQRGIPRPIDGDSNGTDVCDIGAYEFGPTLYAKPGASGDCLSWSDACELSKALDLAQPGFQIWAEAGTYKPTTSTDREATFQLITGVAIYGGFAGTETNLAERDLETNITTLSGDIGISGDNADNSYHVVTSSGVDAMAVLDGFTITGGNANGADQYTDGGGVYNISGSPTLINLTISSNSALYGGGMYNEDSSPNLTNVIVNQNTADFYGGGMYNYSSNLTLTNVTFNGNSTDGWGGGMYNSSSSSSLTNVTFSTNTAGESGGGMCNSLSSSSLINVTFSTNTASRSGGGILNDFSSPMLTNVTFSSNIAELGGGMYNINSSPTLTSVIFSNNTALFEGGGIANEYSDPTLENVTFSSNSADNGGGGMANSESDPLLTNVIFTLNEASENGGGMQNVYSDTDLTNVTFALNEAGEKGGGMANYYSSPTLTNLTFSGNSAEDGGGGIYNYGVESETSNPVITNSILWENTPDQISNHDAFSIPIVTYTVVQGESVYPGEGNKNSDPLLDDLADNGGFTLTQALLAGSSAIDTGDQAACPATDQRGILRPIDGDSDGTAVCDIGAYEFGSTLYAIPGTNGNCLSWSDACDLSQALALAQPGFQIWAAAGTYEPTAVPDRDATFQLKSGVAIYGGFPAAGNPTWEDRDWKINITTLSGDIGTAGDSSDNSYHVVTGSEVDATAILDGFTITGGNADGDSPVRSGGGMYVDEGSPTLTNITFSSNYANSVGGGLYNWAGSPILKDVTFSRNEAGYSGGGVGSYADIDCTTGVCTILGNITLERVTFFENKAGWGGGMDSLRGTDVLIDVSFIRNVATKVGGGMYMDHFYDEDTALYLTNVTFSENEAKWGGGMAIEYNSSPTLTNVTFSGNKAIEGDDGEGGMEGGLGGGLINIGGEDIHGMDLIPTPILTNVTFFENTADNEGGGIYNFDGFYAGEEAFSSPTLTNCILWGNSPDQIGNDTDSSATVTYSVIQAGYPDGTNIIDADPKLDPTLADNGGFTQTHALQTGSPAIDAANPNVCPTTDQRGFPRPVDGDGNGTASCDIGAYEYINYGPVLFAKPGSSGDCSSWSNACDLSQALVLAQPGFQIWAAAGTYKPTEDTDRNATFQLKNSLAIYGGFAGTETSLDQRDWETNPTILSGDIGTLDDNTDNSYHVVTGSGVDTTAILDGFTITGGANQGDITPTNQGGGMYINCGKPALKNIVFYNNTASYGGGLYSRCESNKENAPTLTNVVFDQNTAVYHGGGIYTSRNNLELTNITFSNNKAGIGGGMNNYQSDPSLTNITFIENEAQNQGGAMANHDSSPILTNVTFSGNKATGTNGSGYGSGMYNDDSRPRLTNVTFTLNQAIINGGAMYNTGDPIQGSKPVITNAIIWGNIGGQIVDESPSSTTVTYSVIDDESYSDPTNIFTNPLLGLLADNGGLTLTHALLAGSPAIDTGNSDLAICPTTDQRGYTRPIGAGCDIGAYEYGYTLTVQKEGNGLVDVDPVKPEYNLDELVELTATADPGWTFTGWSGGASGSDNPLTVTMDENKTITATFTKDEVNLTVVANPSEGGSVSTDPAGTVFQAGVEVVLTATSNPGWTFTGWSGDVTSTNNSLTITMDSNKNISANFTQIVYTLSVAIDPLNSGTVTLDPPQTTYNYGDVVTLSPTASPGYTFTGWSGATVTDNKVTIQGNTSITATFTPVAPDEYTLSVVVNPLGKGSVDIKPLKATYQYGEKVTLTALANPGWTFTGWSGDVISTANPLIITMDGNKNITANFTQNVYTLTVLINPVGKGFVNIYPLKATYHYGDTVILFALANPGWTFTGWWGAAYGLINPKTITILGDTVVTANFIEVPPDEYTLSVAVDPVEKGTVDVNPLKATYQCGDEVILTAIPNPGWTFTGWTGDVISTANPLTITMNGNKSITAIFTQDEYTLSVVINPEGKGKVDINSVQVTYHYGDEVSLIATAEPGWTFINWSGDASGEENPLLYTIIENTTIVANFAEENLLIFLPLILK